MTFPEVDDIGHYLHVIYKDGDAYEIQCPDGVSIPIIVKAKDAGQVVLEIMGRCTENGVDYVSEDNLSACLMDAIESEQFRDCLAKSQTLDRGRAIMRDAKDVLDDRHLSEADKRAYLVNALQQCFVFKTIDDTGEIVYYEHGCYRAGGETKIRAELQRIGGYHINEYRRREVIAAIRAKTGVPRAKFDSSKSVLNVKNGLLYVRTRELKPHTAEYLSLVQLPVIYDPQATCPNVVRFLASTLDPDPQELAKRLFGYIIDSGLNFEKAFLFLGGGANGKGTFIKLIIAFVGAENVASVSLQELCSDRFATADLYGKLVNLHADLPSDRLIDASVFKTVTSGDRIRAQRKHQQPFDFENKAKMIYSANQIPESADKSYAYNRRWVVLPFNRTFEGADRDIQLLDKLVTDKELSGLLNVALDGLTRLLAAGGFEDIDLDELRSQHRNCSSDLKSFIRDCCVIDPKNEGLTVLTSDLQSAFERYCKSTEKSCMDIRQLGAMLKALGVNTRQIRKEGSRVRVYVGIALR